MQRMHYQVKTHTFALGNGYFIKFEVDNKAQVYVFNGKFTQLSYIIKIQNLSQAKCIRYYRFLQYSLFFYIINQSLQSKIFDNLGKQQNKFSINLPLCLDEQLLYISQVLNMKKYTIIIAYSSHDQFYLLTIKDNTKPQIFKIYKKQDQLNFISWLSKSNKNINFKNCFIKPYKIDDSDEFILLLVIRDKIMELFLLQLSPQREINTSKLLGKCESLQKIIPNSANFKDIIIITKDIAPKFLQILISYELKDGFMIILLLNINSKRERIFEVTVIFQGLPSLDFSMIYYSQHIFYQYLDKQQNIYKIFRKKMNQHPQKRYNENKQAQILMMVKKRPFFFQCERQLYICSSQQIYYIHIQQTASSQSNDLSQIQQEIAQFKNNINHIYRKTLQIEFKKTPLPLQKIIYIYTEKCRKIIDWIENHFGQLSINEEHTYLILTLQIIATLSAKHLLINLNIQALLNTIHVSQPTFTIRDLTQTLCKTQISSIIQMLNLIAGQDQQAIIKCLRELLIEEQIKNSCYQAIKTIYSQPFQKIGKRLYHKGQLREQSIELIVSCDLGNSFLYQKLCLNNQQLFKRHIILSSSVNLFIEFFFTINFTQRQIKEFLQKVSCIKRQQIKKIFGQILIKGRRLIRRKEICYEKIYIIIQGFLDYFYQLVPQIKKNMPGLLFFFYLKLGYRKQAMEVLQHIQKNKVFKNDKHEVIYLTSQQIERRFMNESKQIEWNNDKNSYIEQILSFGYIEEQDSISQSSEQQ